MDRHGPIHLGEGQAVASLIISGEPLSGKTGPVGTDLTVKVR
jgi:hypothetical protein